MTDPATYIQGRTVQEQMNSLIGYVDERSAEVATDAIASDVAQVATDAANAHSDALAAAASASQASTTLASAVKITGDQSIAGVKTFTGQVIVPTPTANTDAATKKYVDDADALKISITDVNTYAVGLTGNQNVAGDKIMTGLKAIDNGYPVGTFVSNGNWVKVLEYTGNANFILRGYGLQPNNNVGKIEAFIGGGTVYDRSFGIIRFSRYFNAQIKRTYNTVTNKTEVWFYAPTSSLLNATVNISITEGALPYQLVFSGEEGSEPTDSDGTHSTTVALF